MDRFTLGWDVRHKGYVKYGGEIVLSGTIFDIKEFAVNDGPGIRTTFFLKGCPLRCQWCHNPEGLNPEIEVFAKEGGQRIYGYILSSFELFQKIERQSEMLKYAGGGVTFSGGEPLMQYEFLSEVIDLFNKEIHVLLDTSGYASSEAFETIVNKVDHVYFDLKIADSSLHKKWTGSDNKVIHNNLELLDKSGVSYTVRVPLIPDITDTDDNILGIIDIVSSLSNFSLIELLPYNKLAGGKYNACGMNYKLNIEKECRYQPCLSLVGTILGNDVSVLP